MEQPPKLDPVKVKCSDSKCEADLHRFGPNRRKKNWKETYDGACQACGKKLVDWDRVKKRDLSDIEATFADLEHELIRHVFFHAAFDEKSLRQARRLGLAGLKERARHVLTARVGQATQFRDGTQTKKHSSALNYAMHATATCCRKCLEYWHGIPRGRELAPAELDYCEGLVKAYLDARAGELSGDPAPASSDQPAAQAPGEAA